MLPLFPHEDTERARDIIERIKPLAEAYWNEHDPASFGDDPFTVLLVALLSPRTKTEASRAAMQQILASAATPDPAGVAQLDAATIEEILQAQDVRFPENKAQYVIETAQQLTTQHTGQVPQTLPELMQLSGLGWKTSLLTLWLAFGKSPQITVDIHVKRISQRLGLIPPTLDDPQKVSRALMDIVPREYWGWWNSCFVYFGKTRCYPSAPACEGCPIYDLCERVGVTTVAD